MMVQTKKMIMREGYSTITVCLFTFVYSFVKFEVQAEKVNKFKILFAPVIESNLVED